jgi:integrase
MGHSEFDPASRERRPWNAGRMVGAKRRSSRSRFGPSETARASLQVARSTTTPSHPNQQTHVSTRQYARLVDEWVTAIRLRREDYGTHSLRRTKASIIYKATGNLRAVQLLLGHTKIESTARYLGVDVEDVLTLAEHTEV